MEGQGAHNLDLVTGTQFVEPILEALEPAPGIPVVWNTSGYERVETLRRLEGRVQVYLPDLKYMDSGLAARCSGAADYPEAAMAAIREMVRQTGPYQVDAEGLLTRGVLIRHLVLPGQVEDTKRVIDWVAGEWEPGVVLFSLMRQYTPPQENAFTARAENAVFRRRVTAEEYQAAAVYLEARGGVDGFLQEADAADAGFTPAFDFTGV